MTDERCIICGETEDGSPAAEAAHFQSPTHVHEFFPLSKLWKPIDDDVKKATSLLREVLLGWFDGSSAPMYKVGFWHSREKAWCDSHHVLHNQQSHPTHYMELPAPAVPQRDLAGNVIER